MIKNTFKFLLLLLLVLFSYNISNAQTNNNGIYDSRNLRMTAPSGGETFKTGDIVPIEWVVNNSKNVDGRIGIEIINQDSKKVLVIKYVCSSKDQVSSYLCSDIGVYPDLDGKVRIYNRWKIPEYLPTGNYKLYIRYYDKDGYGKYEYGANESFKIINQNPSSNLESSIEINGSIKTRGILLGEDVVFDLIINGGPTINNKKVLVNFVDVNDKTAITSKTIAPAIPSTIWTLTTNIPIRIIDPKLVNGTYNVYVSLYEGDEESAIKNFINRKNDLGYKNIRTVTVGSRSEDIILAVENAKDKIISEDYNYQFFSVFRGNATKVSYKVFVQIVDSKGKIVFQNDFTPTPPTYQWKGADYPVIRKYSFSKSIPAGEYKVLTGLQDGSKKIKLYTYGLQGIISNPDNTYQIATLQLGKSPNTTTNSEQSSNLSILPIDFKNSDKTNYSPNITYRGGQFKFNLNFAGGPVDSDYQINVKLLNEATSKVDFEKNITPNTPTSKWSSNTSIPVVIDIPTDYKASVWAAYRVVVSLRKSDKVLILSNKSEILKSLPRNEVALGSYTNSISTSYLNNGNYIVSRFLIANSNIRTLPSENPERVAVGSDFPITLKFEAKNPEWTYDGSICVGNFFGNNHTTYLWPNAKHNPQIILVPVNSDWSINSNLGIRDRIIHNTSNSGNIADSDTWRGNVSIPVSFKIPNDTKPGKYEIHVVTSISSPLCSISAIPMGGTKISMLQSQVQPSNLVGRVEITTGSDSSRQELITINKWNSTPSVSAGSDMAFNVNFKGGPSLSDNNVFVHVIDQNGEIKFSSDIRPSVSTKKWTNESYNNISGSIQVPLDTNPGLYKVMVGLYNGNNRLTLKSGSGVIVDSQNRYEIGQIRVLKNELIGNTDTPKITINKWKLYNPVAVGSIPSVPVSTSNKISTITFGINFVGGPTDGDKRVFVHFVDSSGNIKFLADVAPSTPSSKWTANSSNWITSEIDIPENIDLGNYNIYAGLYSMDTAVKLNRGDGVTDAGQLRYSVGMINISKPVTFIDVYKKLATGNLFDALTTLINY